MPATAQPPGLMTCATAEAIRIIPMPVGWNGLVPSRPWMSAPSLSLLGSHNGARRGLAMLNLYFCAPLMSTSLSASFRVASNVMLVGFSPLAPAGPGVAVVRVRLEHVVGRHNDDLRMVGQIVEILQKLAVVAVEAGHPVVELALGEVVRAIVHAVAVAQEVGPIQIVRTDHHGHRLQPLHLFQQAELARQGTPALLLRTAQATRDGGAGAGQVQHARALPDSVTVSCRCITRLSRRRVARIRMYATTAVAASVNASRPSEGVAYQRRKPLLSADIAAARTSDRSRAQARLR